MQVHLPAELEAFVQRLIDRGLFSAPGQVFEAALWLLKDQADLHEVKLAELKTRIAVGIEQADRGELIDGELVFSRLREKIEKRAGNTP
jgi:antitoxin ParD1/3/4